MADLSWHLRLSSIKNPADMLQRILAAEYLMSITALLLRMFILLLSRISLQLLNTFMRMQIHWVLMLQRSVFSATVQEQTSLLQLSLITRLRLSSVMPVCSIPVSIFIHRTVSTTGILICTMLVTSRKNSSIQDFN